MDDMWSEMMYREQCKLEPLLRDPAQSEQVFHRSARRGPRESESPQRQAQSKMVPDKSGRAIHQLRVLRPGRSIREPQLVREVRPGLGVLLDRLGRGFLEIRLIPVGLAGQEPRWDRQDQLDQVLPAIRQDLVYLAVQQGLQGLEDL